MMLKQKSPRSLHHLTPIFMHLDFEIQQRFSGWNLILSSELTPALCAEENINLHHLAWQKHESLFFMMLFCICYWATFFKVLRLKIRAARASWLQWSWGAKGMLLPHPLEPSLIEWKTKGIILSHCDWQEAASTMSQVQPGVRLSAYSQ